MLVFEFKSPMLQLASPLEDKMWSESSPHLPMPWRERAGGIGQQLGWLAGWSGEMWCGYSNDKTEKCIFGLEPHKNSSTWRVMFHEFYRNTNHVKMKSSQLPSQDGGNSFLKCSRSLLMNAYISKQKELIKFLQKEERNLINQVTFMTT